MSEAKSGVSPHSALIHAGYKSYRSAISAPDSVKLSATSGSIATERIVLALF
jgi:hypothetical protein